MFRTVSAALLAVSVLAAPALAGAPGKPAKTAHVQAPVIKAVLGNPKVMNAYASMGRHHHYRYHHRHHRHHRH